MSYSISIAPFTEAPHIEFLEQQNSSTLFQNPSYLQIIADVTNSKLEILTLKESSDQIVGLLPFFTKSAQQGTVINAGPFYGGHGGPIVHQDNYEYKKALIDHLFSHAMGQSALSVTLVNGLFGHDQQQLKNDISPSFVDQRIGQYTVLPQSTSDLMSIYHTKTRNMVRKGLKQNITVKTLNNQIGFDYLYRTHCDNMIGIGAPPKPDIFFNKVQKHLQPNRDYNLYIALKKKIPIAALLLFYAYQKVEYYTPVITHEYRNTQALSALIHQAMGDAVQNGHKIWNWGGTGINQTGVYRFKNRWGAIDQPYLYFTKVLDDSILSLTKEVLLDEFEYFFTVPFQNLAQR